MRTRIVIVLALVAVIAGPGSGLAAAAAGRPAMPATSQQSDPAVSQRFDPPVPLEVATPFLPPATRYGSGHRGVDLVAEPGAPIRAAGDGVVVFAGPLAGRGVVSVEHAAGLRTTYEPVTAQVSAGDVVRRGQVIGALQPGHPGCPAGACLHLGARLPDRVYLDPLALFRVWEVRLKPWAGMASGG